MLLGDDVHSLLVRAGRRYTHQPACSSTVSVPLRASVSGNRFLKRHVFGPARKSPLALGQFTGVFRPGPGARRAKAGSPPDLTADSVSGKPPRWAVRRRALLAPCAAPLRSTGRVLGTRSATAAPHRTGSAGATGVSAGTRQALPHVCDQHAIGLGSGPHSGTASAPRRSKS